MVLKELHITIRKMHFNWVKFNGSLIPQKNLHRPAVLVVEIYYHNNACYKISLYRSASRKVFQTKFGEKNNRQDELVT